MGISIPSPAELNMAKLVGWKEGIVDRLNKGVEALLKNAGAELITGWATFEDAKTVKIGEGKDATLIQAEHVIMAQGSVPIELPFMPYNDHVISSRNALLLRITRTRRHCWRRLHRFGIGNHLQNAWFKSNCC